MLWGLIDKLRGKSEEPPAPDVHAQARAIDQYYDSILGTRDMPLELAIDIERERQAAHAALTREVMAAALDGWQGPGRMR